MARREFHFRWEQRLDAPPERLWPLVADTNRFNRDTGLAPVREGAPGPSARRRLAGPRAAWEEEPFEWLEPRRASSGARR